MTTIRTVLEEPKELDDCQPHHVDDHLGDQTVSGRGRILSVSAETVSGWPADRSRRRTGEARRFNTSQRVLVRPVGTRGCNMYNVPKI